jgi:hypothetical protein
MGKDSLIESDLLVEITAYCDLNGLDLVKFVNETLKFGYIEHKYKDQLINFNPTKNNQNSNVETEDKQVEPKRNDVVERKTYVDPSKKTDLYGE